ncbi:MAG: molybdopterin-dependent oxidoreductase [Desulfovibrio sp.]|jgi:thiosulfate reductase/polysulfide reductase chain A|nr:molybdopterin-dependent oxidoreductase [Desulfovibrio sp.]
MDCKTVYSVCGMCAVRCPIVVEVEDGRVRRIAGNPHAPAKGGLCAKGAAGIAFEEDDERPQGPLLRDGPRGAGKWRPVSWDEALDHVAERLKACMDRHGPQTLLWADRDGPFKDLPRAFMRGLGSPNVCTHSPACDLNVHHACKAVTGHGRGDLVLDYDHCRHLVLQSRNVFEALNVAEANKVLGAMGKGCRLTVIDVRPTVTAAKAHDFLRVLPGSDYALNLAVIHVLIRDGLYDREYVAANTTGFERLAAATASCTPAWAEAQTGVQASEIEKLCRDLASAAPHVIWHPGWMASRYRQSFQVSRTAQVITALLGGVGRKGGMVEPRDEGLKALKSLCDCYPEPAVPRADGVGKDFPAFDTNRGLIQRALLAMESGRPYPLKACIAWRHDPLQSLPDPAAVKRALAALDLFVSVTFSWSDTAWHADVVLPLSPYLSRESIIGEHGGFKPHFFLRRRAIQPRFDTRADWEIIGGLAARLGLDRLVFDKVEDLWRFQLEGTGLTPEAFDATGIVELADAPMRPAEDAPLSFLTPSGKVELDSAGWEAKTGVDMLPPYAPPPSPPPGALRLTFGRMALHTHGHTMNNPMLARLCPEGPAWIHPETAAGLGLASGDRVEVLNARGECAGSGGILLSEGVHPEAVFLVHGFGHRLPCESRAFGKGVADQELICDGLLQEDPGGGGLALQEAWVTLRKVESAGAKACGVAGG